jgi:hypothetical protein
MNEANQTKLRALPFFVALWYVAALLVGAAAILGLRSLAIAGAIAFFISWSGIHWSRR